MSRGYDGPEIDDFRDPGWGREPDRPSRDWSRETASEWPAQANVRLKMQKLREAESRSDQPLAESRERPHTNHPDLAREDRSRSFLQESTREKYVDRDRTYSLRPSEIHTLTEVGKFRVLTVEDLAKSNYAGDRSRLESDLSESQGAGTCHPARHERSQERIATGPHSHQARPTHSAASIVNEQTGNLKLAQKFLGHSTIKMTADIYTHTSAEAERDAAIGLERAI